MKKLTNVFAVIMVLTMIFAVAGCGSNTPTDAVNSAMSELQNELSDKALEAMDLDEDDISKDDLKPWLDKLQDFDYEVTDESIDGDSATVTVKITTYDFGKAMADFYEDLFSMVLENPDISQGKITSKFVDALSKPDEKSYTKDVKITCKKDDGQWEVSDLEDNNDLQDAILGGLLSELKELDALDD